MFWRRYRQGDITAEEATESIADLLTLDIPLVPASSLAQAALRRALQHQRTVYDSLYLALAQERDCPLMTADERFFNAVSSPFPNLQLLRNWQPPPAYKPSALSTRKLSIVAGRYRIAEHAALLQHLVTQHGQHSKIMGKIQHGVPPTDIFGVE